MISHSISEDILQSEPHDSRVLRGCHLTEVAAVEIRDRVVHANAKIPANTGKSFNFMCVLPPPDGESLENFRERINFHGKAAPNDDLFPVRVQRDAASPN